MPFPLLIPLALSAAGAIGGALSNRKKKQTSTSTPSIAPEYGPLQQLMIQRATDRLRNPTGLPAGFETGGIKTINDTFDAGQQSLENTLSARGLSRSPIGGTPLGRMQGNRLSTIANFRTGLPLVQRQLQQEDEESAFNLLGLGRGNEFSTNQPGDMLGGGLEGLASMLGFLYGQGAFGGGGAPTSSKMPVRYK